MKVLLSNDDNVATFSEGIVIELDDHAAGPFLKVYGHNQNEEDENAIFLESTKEIDQLCDACKKMITQYGGTK